MPFNRAKPKTLTDNPIIARFLALSQNVTIESIFRSPDPTITRFKTRAKDAHLILIGNSGTPSSNIIQLGYTAGSNESYITQNDTKVVTFHTNNIGLNAPTKISGHLLPNQTSNIYSKNAYISDTIHLQNQTITTSSNSFLFTSNINIKTLTIYSADSNYYTTLQATSNGTIMTSYESNKQIKEINIAKLNTSYFSEGSNEYLTEERVISTFTRDFLDLQGTSNALQIHLYNLSTDLQTNSIDQTNIITTDYLRASSSLIEPIGPAAIIAQQPHIYNYLKTTSNLLIPVIESTSNSLHTTIATTNIYHNLNAFTDATSNIFIYTIIPHTSNVLAQHITDYHTLTSNLILDITSNILTTAIIDSSNHIITASAHHHQQASNLLWSSSNTFHTELYSASNVLVDYLNISVTSVSNLLPPIVAQLTDYLHTASNALISHKVITDTYNKAISFTDSTSNVLQQPIPITSNQFADYLNHITLENVYFQGSSNAYIKNNQYPFNNLTVSNLTTMGSIMPQTDNQYDLGSSTNRFRDIYVSSDSIHIGDTIVSSSPYAVSLHNTSSASHTSTSSATSATIKKIKLADQTTNNFMELSYADDWIKTILYSEQAQTPQQGIQVYKHTDDVIEIPGASNLYFTAQRASTIVSSSNILSSNYSTQTSNTISNRITQLSADDISKQGIHNKFITNNKHNSHLVCYSPVTTTNLVIISEVPSTVDIKTITYDLLQIQTPSASAKVSFKLLQTSPGKDIFNFTKDILMKSTGNIGIGTVPDEFITNNNNRLKLYGSIAYTNNLRINNIEVTSNTMLRLKSLRSPVQAQLNQKKRYISTTISDANSTFYSSLATFSSDINAYNHISYTNSSNYASNMYVYMQPTIDPAFAPLYPILADLDSNMSNYVTHIITDLATEVSTASNALLQQIAPIEEYGSNYNDISIAIQSDICKDTSNLLEDRINYVKSTVWTATDNLSFQNNVLIGQLSKDSQDALGSLAVSGSISVTNLLNGISTHLLGFLRNLQSPLQQQIDNTNTNNSNYVTSTSNNLATDLRIHNYNISSSLDASNADLQQLSATSFASMNAHLNSSSNALASNIRDLTSRGYTQWASMQSSNIYITSNIGVGGIPSNNRLEVHNGDINIAINGHPFKKTFDASLNPLVWYQFSEDPATQSTLLDSTTTKYNLSIPQSSGITRIQGYNLNNYLYKNAYQWSKSAYLESSASLDIQQLLNKLHTARRGSFHFAFRMSSNPSSQIPILFIGYSTSPYRPIVYIYSLANTLYIQMDTITAVSIQAFNINVWYIADIVFTIDALPSNSINISIYINNNKVAAALGTYSNWFDNVAPQDLVLRIGNNPNASTPNDPAPLALQDLRIFALALSSSQLLSLQRGYDATIATTAAYQNILWNDSPQYYDGEMPLKHIVYNSGNVGIGVTSPEAKLHIGNGIYTILTSDLTYFNYGTSLITPQPPYATSISAKFDSSILVTGKVAITSDQRIKKNIEDVNDDSALQKILAIEPKTYSHIDDHNQKEVYGFIAQQVKQILPEAVTLHKEVIPNIYSLSVNIDPDAREGHTVITVPTTTAIEALNIGDRILMDKEELHTIIDISHLDNDTSIITVDASISSEEPVFIYGTEVNDFNVLNKQYIYTLNVCATQTLANKIEQMKTRIANISRRK
jgi:hypothetical protein